MDAYRHHDHNREPARAAPMTRGWQLSAVIVETTVVAIVVQMVVTSYSFSPLFTRFNLLDF